MKVDGGVLEVLRRLSVMKPSFPLPLELSQSATVLSLFILSHYPVTLRRTLYQPCGMELSPLHQATLTLASSPVSYTPRVAQATHTQVKLAYP